MNAVRILPAIHLCAAARRRSHHDHRRQQFKEFEHARKDPRAWVDGDVRRRISRFGRSGVRRAGAEARDVLEGRRADLPGQVPVVPRTGLDRARCRWSPTRTRGRGRGRSRTRVESRQMPPWHIDRSVGVQKFKNDMSLTDEQVATIVAWVDQGAVEGNPADFKAEAGGEGPLLAGRARRLRPARPRHQAPDADDAGRAPGRVVAPGAARSRSPSRAGCKMVEIRPANIAGPQDPAPLDRVPHPQPRQRRRGEHRHRPAAAVRPTPTARRADLVNRRPQLMEWAIGKGYDRYMEGTGKLIMPGEKISWDQHIHAAGEEDHERARKSASGSIRKARSRPSAATSSASPA